MPGGTPGSACLPPGRRFSRLIRLMRLALIGRLAGFDCSAHAPTQAGAARLLLALCALALSAPVAAAPERVVSINLCTDQLAMLIADPGQIASVSFLASEPESSAMVAEAAAFPANHGRAEEVFLLDPDLVLTGAYSAPVTVAMLRQLGFRVEQVAAVRAVDDVPGALREVGALLGQDARAEAMAAAFEADLAALRAEVRERPRAALYYANGYTLGGRSLAGQILLAAGFDNVASEAGYDGGGRLPLELLVALAPEIVIEGQRYAGASRSEAILDHPVLAALDGARRGDRISDSDWVCGTPYVLRAIRELAEARRALTGE